MKKKYSDMTVGESLIESLKQAVDYEQGKKVEGVRSRKISIAPLPHYSSSKIKEIRNKLGFSQSAFAYIIGVSKKTIEAWEAGKNDPQGPAQRMLMLMEKDHRFIEKYSLVMTT